MFYFRKSGFSSRFISFDTFSSPYFALARQLWTLPREVSRELHWKRKERKKHQQRFISLTGVLKVSTISSAFCTFVIATGFNLLRWYDTAMWSWRGGGGGCLRLLRRDCCRRVRRFFLCCTATRTVTVSRLQHSGHWQWHVPLLLFLLPYGDQL